MLLNEFLYRYRLGVKANTGKLLSRKSLIENIFKNVSNSEEDQKKFAKRLEKWEAGTSKPSAEDDRIRIKTYFGIENLENIDDFVLKEAVDRYPNGLGSVGIPNPSAGKNIPLGGKTINEGESGMPDDIDLQQLGAEFDTDSSDLKHAPEIMMNRITEIMRLHALKEKDDAAARLHESIVKDRLTAMLERMEARIDRIEGIAKKERVES